MLYAIYVCLLLAILLLGIIYVSNLNMFLRVHYENRDRLLIENQSATEYWLGFSTKTNELETDFSTTSFFLRKHGLLPYLVTQTCSSNDTVSTVHFLTLKGRNKNALVTGYHSPNLYYSGNVRIIGTLKTGSRYIAEKSILNERNNLTQKGGYEVADFSLPKVSAEVESVLTTAKPQSLHSNSNSSRMVNSFLQEPIFLDVTGANLSGKRIIGNYILSSRDSIFIDDSTILQDVIVQASRVTVGSGFKGNIQIIADESVVIQDHVHLLYPSYILVRGVGRKKNQIKTGNQSYIFGNMVLLGNNEGAYSRFIVSTSAESVVAGDIYSSGIAALSGKVYGSVYAERLGSVTNSKLYENVLRDIEIDVTKRMYPDLNLPLLPCKSPDYEISKLGY